MGMDQYLLIPFLMGWTSIYQLVWGLPGFWPIIKSGKLDIRKQRTWTHQQPTYRKGSHSPDYALASNAALASDFFGAPQFWHFDAFCHFTRENDHHWESIGIGGSLFSFIFNQIQTEFDYAGSLDRCRQLLADWALCTSIATGKLCSGAIKCY